MKTFSEQLCDESKAAIPELFPEFLRVNRDSERLFTTSLKVAEHFGKRHDLVLRDIRNLACTATFLKNNYERGEYLDGRGKTQPMYHLSHDGFAMLAMGFTGSAATRIKETILARTWRGAPESSATHQCEHGDDTGAGLV